MINSQSQPLLNITLVLKFCAKNYKVNLVVKLKIKNKKIWPTMIELWTWFNNIQYISTKLQCKYVTEIKPTGYPVFKRYIVKLELTDTQIIF
jgi:hypothetical protein